MISIKIYEASLLIFAMDKEITFLPLVSQHKNENSFCLPFVKAKEMIEVYLLKFSK